MDPTFTSRDEMLTWCKQRLRYPDPSPTAQMDALEDIRRVTLAHSHLLRQE